MSFKNTINKFLRKFNVELHGLGYLQALSKGELKTNELDIFKNVFQEQSIVIYDVGANRGSTIRSFIESFPNSTIHAFEPHLPFYDDLVLQYGQYKNIIINNLGISDIETKLIFNVNRSLDTSSFLTSKQTGLNSDSQVVTVQQIKVPVTTLENYTKIHEPERINILKLDIQGSELRALKGALNLLKNQKIDMIFCETYFIQQYDEQPLFFEIAQFLAQFDYHLQDIYHPIYGKGKIAWCDSMFVRKGLKLY
jgi:FkbM family methyltransferase